MPALRALKHSHPHAELVLAAQARIGELLAVLGVVDRALPFETLELGPLFSDVGGPDEGGVAQLARFSRVVSWFGARDPVFVRRLTALVPEAVIVPSVGEAQPVWEHLLSSVGARTADSQRWRVPVAVPAVLADEGRQALRDAGWDGEARVVVVHPGAGGVAKRWPAEGFAAVLEQLALSGGLLFAIHQGPADASAVTPLRARFSGPVIDLEEPALPRLAGVLASAGAYLGNDSGVSHLAAALGTPSVVLFTADKLAWRPWGASARTLVVSTTSLDRDDVERALANMQEVVSD